MRDGYKLDFLGGNFQIELPGPGLALRSDILQPPGFPDGELVVPYINYSLLMSRSTRSELKPALRLG
jgi:endonuclease G